MFKNYIMVAVRNLVKNKLYSAINIVGLAVGLAACVMIALFVKDELSYDTQWAKADSLYRLHTTFTLPGRAAIPTVRAPGPVKSQILEYFPEEIAATTRFNSMNPVLRYEGKVVSEQIFWTDPETADLFDFNVVAGDIHKALNDNSSLAVNETFAKRYFGDADPIGKVVTLTNYQIERDYKITAVFEDLPNNTVLDIQALAKIDEADFTGQTWEFGEWYSTNNYLFFELKEGADVGVITSQLNTFINASAPPSGGEGQVTDFMQFSVQALTDIQLYPFGRNGSEMKPTGSMTSVIIFVSIAVLILLIACINFMNLATAKSTQRAREVALRKVLGAKRGQLVTQFLGETVMVAVMGLVLGIVLVEVFLGPFSAFVGKELAFDYGDGLTISVLVGLVLFVGTIGGVYPALVLSGFLPATVLKANKSAETNGSAALRNGLVVVQFAISIGLIIATSAVFGQRWYATSMDPGFNKDNLMIIRNVGRAGAQQNQDAFRREVLRLPGVVSAAYSSDSPASGNESNRNVMREGADPATESVLIGTHSVDYEFFDTYEIELLKGRIYSRDFATDGTPAIPSDAEAQATQGTLIINEAASRRLGFTSVEEAVGSRVRMGRNPASMEIIAVIRDMQYQSLRRVMRPEMYLLNRADFRTLTVKYTGSPAPVASAIEGVWRTMMPDVPFRHDFVDTVMAAEFEQESQQSVLLAVFAGLAIVIACLGLYGLASFTAERRTKEIGIRKVMGATVFDIVRLLIWQFSKPVLLANVIAWPIVVYGLVTWLETFPYRLEAWWLIIFCLSAGTIALSIAWVTVGGNAASVARTNPIKALRYE
ncbi:MAG: hypothetical protein COB37_05070 [Kordiimonadales bacterium]|nr:MAG: hypothetical protein COB37_05070 [Kordiimonadales bacterium]